MSRQCDRLLNYLIKYGFITGMTCITKLGVMNYKGRIHDLRRLGAIIDTEMVYYISESGEHKSYAIYIYKGWRAA